MGVSGKVGVVFGGARGIGEACASSLLQAGAKVCISDINAELGAATCEKLQTSHPAGCVIFVPCDVTDDKQIEKTFDVAGEKLGGQVEICVVTAGVCNEEDWKMMLQLNLMASISATYIAQQKMGTQSGGSKGGDVILLASICGIDTMPSVPVYTATKHGIVGFVRAVAPTMLKQAGVRVNALCPNLVQTELVKNLKHYPLVPRSEFEELMASATKFMITTEQVAAGMMKVLEEEQNGSTLIYTKHGKMELFNEPERTEKLVARLDSE